MSRLIPLGAALAVTAASVTLAVPQADAHPGTAAHQAASAATKSPSKRHTSFALRNVGYGSRVQGGLLPASSSTTSYQGIGCTNKAGIQRRNYAANATLPNLGEIDGVNSHNWTTRNATTVASMSKHSVAKVVLDLRTLGSLEIDGITSMSTASHTATGFKADTVTDVADISYLPPTGPAVDIAIPSLNTPITIPGVVTLSVGHSVKKTSAAAAIAAADGLDIQIIPTNTRIRLAHSAAQLSAGIKRGVFSGSSNATRVSALDDNVKSGPQPLTIMPCQGTYGHIRSKAVASTNLAGEIVVGAASSSQMGLQTTTAAKAYEQSKIASVDIGNGQLVVNGIEARANGVRTAKGVKYDSVGTTIGSATVNGTTYALPDLNGLTIPGVLSVKTDVVTQSKSKIDVIALQITLLDGTGAVVDLGHAALNIRNSHL